MKTQTLKMTDTKIDMGLISDLVKNWRSWRIRKKVKGLNGVKCMERIEKQR